MKGANIVNTFTCPATMLMLVPGRFLMTTQRAIGVDAVRQMQNA
jgi:hypothetical protein